MANRGLLAKNDLPEFEDWLKEQGFQWHQTKGVYEAIRYKKGSKWVIVFQRDKESPHLTVRENDEMLVRDFLKYKNGEVDLKNAFLPKGIRLYAEAKEVCRRHPHNVIKRSQALRAKFSKTQLAAIIMALVDKDHG